MDIEKNLQGLFFQTFYVSKEESNCPLIADILRLNKKLQNINNASISHRYGKRVLFNNSNIKPEKTKKEDFLEIVDYNPFKKTLMVMGKNKPTEDAPLHWFIINYRKEINAIVLIKDKDYMQKFQDKFSIADKKLPIWSVEKIKEIMKLLADNKKIYLRNTGILYVGKSLKEIEDIISNDIEGAK